jgi:hypothetical protein
MFLAPTTILLTALGLAKTQGLKAGISAVGLAIALVWLCVAVSWSALNTMEQNAAFALAAISGIVWLLSFIIHGLTTVGAKGALPAFAQPDETR